MSRYRPPQPKSSPYITRDGHERLRRELDALWGRRREVVEALAAAAAEGDRSENAEYVYRKRELAGIDRRLLYLQRRLPALKIVEPRGAGEQVYFGAEVTLELESGGAGGTRRVRIVGADEIDPGTERISVDSPLARALLGKGVDDSVAIEIEGRRLLWRVLGVAWPADDATG